MSIGTVLKKYRKMRGFNAKEFSKKVLIPYSTYSNYENDNRKPNFENLKKICDALEITIDDFIVESSVDSKTIKNDRENLGIDIENVSQIANIPVERFLEIESGSEPTDIEKHKIAVAFSSEVALSLQKEVIRDLASMVMEKSSDGELQTSEIKEFLEKYNQLNWEGKVKALEFVSLLLKTPDYKE